MIWPVQQHSTFQTHAYCWMCCRADEEVLADAFEALVGAVYLDSGIEAASRFLIKLAEVSVICCYLSGPSTASLSLQPVNRRHDIACMPNGMSK